MQKCQSTDGQDEGEEDPLAAAHTAAAGRGAAGGGAVSGEGGAAAATAGTQFNRKTIA